MPKVCCVLNCGNSSRFTKNITYHKVPAENKEQGEIRKIWLKKIRRRDFLYNPTSYIYVCSKHFKHSDFTPGLTSGRNRLKDDVIPSQFDWDFSTRDQIEPSVPTQHDSTRAQIQPSVPTQDIMNNENLVTVEQAISEEGLSNQFDETLNKIKQLEEENLNLKKEVAELKMKVAVQEELISVKNSIIKQTGIQLKRETLHRVSVERKLKEMKPSIENIKNSDEDILFYTGLPSYHKLMALYSLLDPGENGENINLWRKGKENADSPEDISPAGRPRILNVKDQFLLVLMRLRLGLFVKDLGHRFGVSPSTISNICNTWINLMYFRLGQINIWPPREKIDATMPAEFKETYPTTRVILDATEIKVETAKSLVMQTATYSNYKSCNTLKGLVGISPSGYVTFVSHLFTGSISDKEITRRSGFLSLDFDTNDSVMADKGFTIADMLKEINVDLNIPPFLRENRQFSKQELEATQKIAAVRIHVERRIARIRGFHIFDRPIPLCLVPVVNQLWTVVVLLTNFQTPIIKEKEELVISDSDVLERSILWDEEITEDTTLDSSFREEIMEPEGATLDSSFEDVGSEVYEEPPVLDLTASFD